ncbi:hypothetical protein BDW66DRAFT_150857 [Aspergillus desertorum]
MPSDAHPDRSALTSRAVPSMTLGNGSAASLTAPAPAPKGAASRFAVTGNAVVTGGAGNLGLTACTALLEHGLQGLMILDMNPSIAEKEINSLRAKFTGAKITTAKVDITDGHAVDGLL